MREIKFRAWDGRNMHENAINCKPTKTKNTPDYYEVNVSHCFKEVLMQYTGLKDKNVIDIYEFDVLGGGESEPRVVMFENGSFVLNDKKSNQANQVLVPFTCERLSVLGNIYENPELLEE